MQIKMTLPHSNKMAPYCSTDRQMLVHESLNAQDPQHLCEAAQPTPITLGRLSESGQRRWFQKQLCFNPLCPAARTTTQNRPVALTCGNEERLMSQICWASQQATSTMQPRCTGMEDGQSPVGRVMPTVGSRGRQVWLHGLALLPSSEGQRHTAGMASAAETAPGTRALQRRKQMSEGKRRFPPVALHWELLQHVPA